MKFWLGLCCCLVLVVCVIAQLKPPKEFVPDEATAIKIAEAVLIPVWGEKEVVSERPYTATLQKDVWTVRGTLYCGNDGKGGRKSGSECLGGTLEVKLSKIDGRIHSMIHGK